MEALGINLGYLLVQILNFGILFIVLFAWVYKPLLNMLEKRRQTVAQGLEDARVAADARANAEKEAEQIINDAQVRAAEIVREATMRAEAVEQELRSQSEAEVASSRKAALADLEQERNLILSGLRSQVVSLAIAAAQRIIGDSLDEARQHRLLEEFFSGIKNNQMVMLQTTELAGESAEVTSALPLTQNEQDTIKRDLLKTSSAGATVIFRVDPTILGGLIVRVGDRMVDASVSGQLQDLRQDLQ